MTNASLLRHNEDIANRNIIENNSSHGSSVHSLTETDSKDILRFMGRRGSVAQESRNSSLSSTNQSSVAIETPASKQTSQYSSNRSGGVPKVARDEPRWGKRKSNDDANSISQASSDRDFGGRSRPRGELMDLRAAVMDGSGDDRDVVQSDSSLASDLEEQLQIAGVDISDSVDVDRTTRWAPGTFLKNNSKFTQ